MTSVNKPQHHTILQKIAQQAMLESGLLPDFSPAALAELDQIHAPAVPTNGHILDLRHLLWCSIDNDDSRDLDQLTTAEILPDGTVKIYVAVADVDSLVKKGSAIDNCAGHNTTSVYTAAQIFPMLPEKLSTDLTSLNFNEDRLSLVIEAVIGSDGSVQASDVYQASVHSYAKLAYKRVAAWLEGNSPVPDVVAAVPGLDENLRLQDRVAQSLHNYRHAQGALSLESIEARPVFDGEQLRDLEVVEHNRAKDLIENFMITVNGVVARTLTAKNFPSIRRVVRTPKRWDRIVEIVAQHGTKLPETPDSKALEIFLNQARAADPLRFPDLSLSIIKLLGAGEYVADFPNDDAPGHFGLAVKDYAHSTAPNRRYTDLITHRLLKSALDGEPLPYTKEELDMLAAHCTEAENTANKVERQVSKSAAALLLEEKIGQQFDALVTGAAAKGTWVRLLSFPIEGKLVRGFEGVDVGDRVRVHLDSVDVERGFIDFSRVDSAHHI
jgi:exoribonuclease-2